MNIVVKRYNDQSTLPLHVDNPDATVGDLKELISDKLRVQKDAQRLVFPNRELEDARKLADLQLNDGKFVYLLIRNLYISKFQVYVRRSGNRTNFRICNWYRMESLFTAIASFLSLQPGEIVIVDRHANELKLNECGNERITKMLGVTRKYKIDVIEILPDNNDGENDCDALGLADLFS